MLTALAGPFLLLGRFMVALLLTLGLSLVLAGLLWLGVGARLRLNPDSEQNDVLNLISYFLLLLPFAFLFVFFVVERL